MRKRKEVLRVSFLLFMLNKSWASLHYIYYDQLANNKLRHEASGSHIILCKKLSGFLMSQKETWGKNKCRETKARRRLSEHGEWNIRAIGTTILFEYEPNNANSFIAARHDLLVFYNIDHPYTIIIARGKLTGKILHTPSFPSPRFSLSCGDTSRSSLNQHYD